MSQFISISDARADLPSLVDRVSQGSAEVFLTVNGQPKIALISFDELESIKETAEIMAIPGAKQSIKKGLSQAKKGQGKPLKDLLI